MVRILGLLVAFTFACAIQTASNLERLAVSVIINALHATIGADSFCSSLLHISPKITTTTTTSTGTSTSTINPTSTITLTNAAAGTSVSFLQPDTASLAKSLCEVFLLTNHTGCHCTHYNSREYINKVILSKVLVVFINNSFSINIAHDVERNKTTIRISTRRAHCGSFMPLYTPVEYV
jgi:hypothetical protein